MLPRGPLLPFNRDIRFIPGAEIHFPIVVASNDKVKKFSCILYQLDALRGLLILVSFTFESGTVPVFAAGS